MRYPFSICGCRAEEKRASIWVLLGLFCLLGTSFTHQATAKELPRFEFSAVQIGDSTVPPLYYLEVIPGLGGKPQTKFVPISVSNGTRSGTFKIQLIPPVQLYTTSPTGPEMKPLFTIPANDPKNRILLVFHPDNSGQLNHTFLDDSAIAHPPGGVRVVNLGTVPISFSAGKEIIRVAPRQDAKTMPTRDNNGLCPFKCYVEQPDQPLGKAPTKLLRMGDPQDRLLVLYTFFPEEPPSAEPSSDGKKSTIKQYIPIAYRLYDRLDKLAN